MRSVAKSLAPSATSPGWLGLVFRIIGMWLFMLLLLLAAAYVVVLAVMYVAQDKMLFPVGIAAATSVSLPASAVRLKTEAENGDRIVGVHIPPADDKSGDPFAILGFGGNAWNADTVAAYLHDLFPGAHIVAFHYRGYPPSTGRPSAAALLADAPVIYDHVREAIKPDRIVAVGFSIGSGIATHLASKRSLYGLILVSPFDSLEALAREHFRWAPVGWFLRHTMTPVNSVAGLETPTALLVANRDTIVPPRRTEPVRQAIANLVFDHTIADAGHNDLYERPEFHAAMIEALAKIEAAHITKAETQ